MSIFRRHEKEKPEKVTEIVFRGKKEQVVGWRDIKVKTHVARFEKNQYYATFGPSKGEQITDYIQRLCLNGQAVTLISGIDVCDRCAAEVEYETELGVYVVKKERERPNV